MKTFKGRVILGGNLEGEALVTHQGFNTLAAYVQGLITKSPIRRARKIDKTRLPRLTRPRRVARACQSRP
jgi:hypothetical protein